MDKDYYKNEMIKRYCYLNDYSTFIFSTFMKEDLNDYKKQYKELLKYGCSLDELNKIDIKLIDSYSLYMIESLLFEDKPLEDTEGFIYFEILRTNPLNIDKNIKGMELKDKFNGEFHNDIIHFDTLELLSRVYENIARQSSDFDNKNNKLKIIDEYIRISKYSNDGVNWRGGYYLDNIDRMVNPINFRYYVEGKDLSLSRLGYDVGIKNNQLIEITKDIELNNEDKKKIYFKYHAEIPYDLKIRCNSSESLEIDRPEYSKPCNKEFILKRKEIFSLEEDNSYTFLTLCPSCLYIVGVKANLIPKSIQEDIIWNNKKDPLIYKESYLKSDLASVKRLRLNK